MAVYKIDVKIFSRGKGGCVTRAAAYRAGERIRDERTGAIHNFSYRDDVVHKEILLPAEFSGRADMDWARDRATLWNSAERTGLRNARLGREAMVVLPGELSAAQRVQLARRFGQELADRYRAGVDVTVHLPRSGSADIGHHAHILMTARRVTPEGIGARTILELSGTELHSRGLGPSKKELLLIRERWAVVTNEAFREAGLDLRIDHRSLKERGIDREPGLVLPRKIFCMERRYGPSEVGDRFRAEYRERVEARLKGPDELACVLQKQKEEQRRRAIEKKQRIATAPKKRAYAARSREELLQRRRELYRTEGPRREKQLAYFRKYRQDNAEAIRQRSREARLRAKPSPQLQAAQRWRQSRERERELELAQVRRQGRQGRQQTVEAKRGQEKEPEQRYEPALTARDSARNWLALRERQKQGELAPDAVQRRTQEHSRGKSMDEDDDEEFDRRRKRERNRDYDYGL